MKCYYKGKMFFAFLGGKIKNETNTNEKLSNVKGNGANKNGPSVNGFAPAAILFLTLYFKFPLDRY